MRQAGTVSRPEAELWFAAELRMFLAPRHRGGLVLVACDGVSSLGHVVESLGVPLPETGSLTVNGGPVTSRNGSLAPARKSDIEPLLRPGTRRTYQAFSRCRACDRVYWRGAHSQRLQQVVDAALAMRDL